MRSTTFLFIVFCQLIAVSGVSAQDDVSVDPTLNCLDSCTQTHAMCVSTATFWDCISNNPACTGVAPRGASIIAAFCDACGGATVGCEAGTGPVVAGSEEGDPPDTGRGGAVLPSSERPPTPAERERDAQARARGICNDDRGRSWTFGRGCLSFP